MKMKYIVLFMFASALAAIPGCREAETSADDETATMLRACFTTPPQSAKPLLWWHWMNGNITEDGVRKDIEWMNRIGAGGFHVFDANFTTPKIVEERLDYMSAGWKKAFRTAISMSDSLGFDVGIASSPGFSSTGGPWVKPEDAMKKLVWSETPVQGGRHFHGSITLPPGCTGKFQDMPNVVSGPSSAEVSETYYKDVAIIAARRPTASKSLVELGARVTSSGGSFSVEQLSNGRLNDVGRLPAGNDGYAWVQYEFDKPQSFRSLTVVNVRNRSGMHSPQPVCDDSLLVSDDGVNFRTVAGIPIGGCAEQTISFEEAVTGKYFRLKRKNPKAPYHYTEERRKPDPLWSELGEFRLFTEVRTNHFEEKAVFGQAHDIRSNPSPEATEDEIWSSVIDLSDCFRNGILDWDFPEGEWVVFRFGASLTGKKNHPASPEATGLEVDKLDADAWTRYFRNYIDMYKEAADGLLGERGIRHMLTDSYEANVQNWTPRLRDEFRKRRGYDPRLWLPAMTGAVIESTARTEKFLLDLRLTLGELFSENYARLSRLVKEDYGMEGCFIESHENGRVFPADGMQIKKTALYPMSGMWVPGKVGTPDRDLEGKADIRESASVAHIYGQNLVAAESLTSIGLERQAYSYCPENLKHTVDMELSCGLNRFVIHDSAHQPCDDVFPGLGLGVYGQWFTRHETWAEQAVAWMDYLSRSSAMLQQGRNVADILWLYGDDNNITGLYSHSEPQVPSGFNYDFAGPETLLEAIRIENGRLVTDSGMSYGMLCLDPSTDVLSDRAKGMIESIRSAGIPVVEPGKALEKACRGIEKDFDGPDSLKVVHRTLEGADIYWVSNPSGQRISAKMSFRTDGHAVEIWNAESAEMLPTGFFFRGGRTVVPLDLAPDDAVFVVFLNSASHSRKVKTPKITSTRTMNGPWTVRFQQGRGAPEGTVMEELCPLNESSTEGIRHFSGTAIYRNTFRLESIPDGRIELSLGDVKNIAEVFVNGMALRTLWRPPFKLDISEAVHEGENELEVRVTNLWVNRLIGDAKPDYFRGKNLEFTRDALTFTPKAFYVQDDPLLPSGLLGPVNLNFIK